MRRLVSIGTTHLEEDDAKDRVILSHPRVLHGHGDVRLAPIPDEALRASVEHRRARDGLHSSLVHKFIIKRAEDPSALP